jgi:hypothetical protein
MMRSLGVSMLTVLLVGLFVTLAPSTVGAVPADDGIDRSGSKIEVWVRANGKYASAAKFDRPGAQVVALDKLGKKDVRTMFDAQMGAKGTWRGFPISKVFKDFSVPSGVDTAILHFANGMIVPLPLDEVTRDPGRLRLFVALEFKDSDGAWSSNFPPLSKEDDSPKTDPRPIQFRANRLITASLWHPDTTARGKGDFSPWHHVDSLVAIELVSRSGWERQFASDGSPSAIEGQKVFFARCQYCHGIYLIGARYGWDFVEPLPVWKTRRPETLFNHVKYPKMDAVQRGLMMPPQKDVKSGEMFLLWKWMESVAKNPPPRYER